MNLSVAGSIASILGLVIAVFAWRNGFKGKNKKMKTISAENRLLKVNEILCRPHQFVLNVKDSAFVFMPNGEIIFGAAWVNLEWKELLTNFIAKNGHLKITVASAGQYFYLTDLISGENIAIPKDPQKGITIEKSGVSVGHIYIFTKY